MNGDSMSVSSSQPSDSFPSIRLIQTADIPSLSYLYAHCFQDNPAYRYLFPGLSQDRLLQALQWLFTIRIQALMQHQVPLYVAIIKGEVVGGAGCTPHSRKPSLWSLLSAGLIWWPFRWGVRSFLRGFLMNVMVAYVEGKYAPSAQAEVIMVAVSPAQRKLGVGQSLLCRILDDSAFQNSNICLSTQDSANLRFYSKFGFKLAQAVRVLGVDGYVMMRTAPQPTKLSIENSS